MAEPRESLGGNEHRKTEQIASGPHLHPLGFYHFPAVQPNFQLPAPAFPFPRALVGMAGQEHQGLKPLGQRSGKHDPSSLVLWVG